MSVIQGYRCDYCGEREFPGMFDPSMTKLPEKWSTYEVKGKERVYNLDFCQDCSCENMKQLVDIVVKLAKT